MRASLVLPLILILFGCGDAGTGSVVVCSDQGCTINDQPVLRCEQPLSLTPCWEVTAEDLAGPCRSDTLDPPAAEPCAGNTSTLAGGDICSGGGYCGGVVCTSIVVSCATPRRVSTLPQDH